MDQVADIIDRIKALMAEGDIAPTPANYEFWHRYVTRADTQLVEVVDRMRRKSGKVTARVT